MHCNQLTHIHCPAAAFQELETLNLSYNQLDGSVFMELAKLPVLQRVDLSCNGIAALPSDLSFLKVCFVLNWSPSVTGKTHLQKNISTFWIWTMSCDAPMKGAECGCSINIHWCIPLGRTNHGRLGCCQLSWCAPRRLPWQAC